MNLETIIISLIINTVLAFIVINMRKKYIKDSSTSSNLMIFIITLFLPLLGIVLIVYYGIKLIFKKPILETIKDVADTAQERVHEYRVQKIAEDEAIRATVKKTIENSDDTSELQELINKAVAKGDTETAQALLAIMNK